MGSHPFPEIPCKICAKAIDLNVDLLGDENGKAVHGERYVRRIAVCSQRPPVATLLWIANLTAASKADTRVMALRHAGFFAGRIRLYVLAH
jgi:hypothetical protein